jgi:hypothetical protein
MNLPQAQKHEKTTSFHTMFSLNLPTAKQKA